MDNGSSRTHITRAAIVLFLYGIFFLRFRWGSIYLRTTYIRHWIL